MNGVTGWLASSLYAVGIPTQFFSTRGAGAGGGDHVHELSPYVADRIGFVEAGHAAATPAGVDSAGSKIRF
jgi:hypothetical protein